MKIGETIFPLDFVDPELDFAEGMVFILLQIGERDFEYPPLESIVCILETCCSIDQRFSDTAGNLVWDFWLARC